MINVYNRRELITTYSMNVHNEIRETLDSKKE